jgi:hypothetical protein
MIALNKHLEETMRSLASLVLSLTLLTGLAFATTAAADPQTASKRITIEAAFEDVFQDLQDAIVNRGLVIDYVGNTDKMLERTSKAVGSVTEAGSGSPYKHAKYLVFCSSKLTHEAVSATPLALSICPYVVFAFELKSKPGEVTVGFRKPIPGPSLRTKKAYGAIENLMTEIITEATSG